MPDDLDDERFFEEIKFETEENPAYGEVLDVVTKQAVSVPWYIIRYDSRFRVYWDLFIILLAVYNCILIPIDVGFGSKFYGTNGRTVDSVDSVLDIFFGLDFAFNFLTTFVSAKTGLQVTDGKKIAHNYLTSYSCYIDLLATIPFDQLALLFAGGTDVNLGFFGVLKLVRLLRLRRIVTFLKVNSGFQFGIRLIQSIGMLILIVHWYACIWYLIVYS